MGGEQLSFSFYKPNTKKHLISNSLLLHNHFERFLSPLFV